MYECVKCSIKKSNIVLIISLLGQEEAFSEDFENLLGYKVRVDTSRPSLWDSLLTWCARKKDGLTKHKFDN